MKIPLFAAALLFLSVSACLCRICAQEADVNVAFEDLRRQLLNSRLPAKDMQLSSSTLMKLLQEGVDKSDLAGLVFSISSSGISGTDLNACLEAVLELVGSGVKPGEAAGVVLDGVGRGLALGFKGGDMGLLAEVDKAVKEKEDLIAEESKKKAEESGDGKAGMPKEAL